jgi:hypothetical protein
MALAAPGLTRVAAQTKPSAAATKTAASPLRTVDGQPDLQGVWDFSTVTPLERPVRLGDKAFFTNEQEAAQFEKEEARCQNRDLIDPEKGGSVYPAESAGGVVPYNEFWYDRGTKVVPTRRTSIVVDPPDGRVPPLTPAAQKAAASRAAIARRPPEGPEDLSPAVRCLVWPTSGPPMLPTAYNNYYQIVQGPGYVAILVEMIHDVRIIPLDGRPHLPANIRQWMGDSRGRWDGDTLVVDTTNFTDKTNLRGSDKDLHLVERFTRISEYTILYQFTVDDPTAFTRVWKGEIPLTKAQGPIYEYACHEGNYSMEGILKGARAQEKAAAEPKKDFK